ncbi:MAG: acyl-CoA dehydrogenase family protein [Caulobacteraceae bacterium]|nr:acyl-CoA dehydrogenase family protein [Caulobacteraceae bacterium]
MDFGWSPDQEAYRAKVRSFLDETLPPDWWENYAGEGPASPEVMGFAKEFLPKLGAAGYVAPHWPAAYGGADLDAWSYTILGEELWSNGEPRSSGYMGSNWVGPAIIEFGTEEQKQKYLGAITRGEFLWCQGFSEPHAGTDLLAMRTRAVRDGAGYRINGSKIWTSYAARAQICFLLARMDEEGGGKAAITCFLMPTDTPGVEIRPIKAIHTDWDIHEIFLTDVWLPESARLGAEGEGWGVVSSIFHHERIGAPRPALCRRVLDRIVEHLRERGLFEQDAVRAQAANALALVEASRQLFYLVTDGREKDRPASTDTNIARLAIVRAEHALMDLVMAYLPDLLAEKGGDSLLRYHLHMGAASGLGAGSAEVQLNMIGGRRLGLPRGA